MFRRSAEPCGEHRGVRMAVDVGEGVAQFLLVAALAVPFLLLEEAGVHFADQRGVVRCSGGVTYAADVERAGDASRAGIADVAVMQVHAQKGEVVVRVAAQGVHRCARFVGGRSVAARRSGEGIVLILYHNE